VLARARDDITHQHARARALLAAGDARAGYAVVQRSGGEVVASVGAVTDGTPLRIRVADGRIAATTTGVAPDPIEESHG
jgi:exodeoxyribonuclease VII large subunit